MSNPTKYYFLAPTWHHHPKSGALQLGNVFLDLGAPEDPIHRGPPPPPPKETDFPPEPGSGVLTESWQTNYIFKAEEFRSGKLGIWTRFLTILGIKVDLAHEWNKGSVVSPSLLCSKDCDLAIANKLIPIVRTKSLPSNASRLPSFSPMMSTSGHVWRLTLWRGSSVEEGGASSSSRA